MRLDVNIGRREGLPAKLGRWAWLPLAPLVPLLAFVLFLAVNRIGNDFESNRERPPLEETRPDADEIYSEEPELYPALWPADTTAGRLKMRERWEGDLSRLEDNPEDAATRERVQAALERLSR